MADHRTVSRRALEGFTTGTLDVYDELIADGFVDHDPQNPFATTLHGPQLMRSAVVLYRWAFPDLVLTVEEQYEDGEVVISRFKAAGTQMGGLPGLPPAARPMTIGGVQIDRFDDDDQIAEGWRYWDTLGMLQQLGAVPTPPAAPSRLARAISPRAGHD
jgi:predicted ester cyclase